MSVIRCVVAAGMVLALLLAAGAARAGTGSRDAGHAVLAAGEVVAGPFFAAGETVEISGRVKGDLYAAGGRILIDGVVDGDLLAAGGTVLLSGRVGQDVRLAGGQVTITGEIDRNLTVAGGHLELTRGARLHGALVAGGGQLHLAAPVAGDAYVAGGSLVLDGPVAGTVKAAGGAIRLTSQAALAGDLVYSSREPASIDPRARIGGQIRRQPLPADMPTSEGFPGRYWSFRLMAVLVNFVSTLVLGLLLLRFFPRFSERAATLVGRRPLPSLGLGFLLAIGVPLAAVLLAMTVVGLPLALVLFAAFLPALYLARIVPIFWLGRLLFPRRQQAAGGGMALAAGLFIYDLLTLVPVLGGVMILMALLFGLGAGALAQKECYDGRTREVA